MHSPDRLARVAAKTSPGERGSCHPSPVSSRSEFPLEGAVEDGGKQGVEFGGGLGLQALQRGHLRLQPAPFCIGTKVIMASVYDFFRDSQVSNKNMAIVPAKFTANSACRGAGRTPAFPFPCASLRRFLSAPSPSTML